MNLLFPKVVGFLFFASLLQSMRVSLRIIQFLVRPFALDILACLEF